MEKTDEPTNEELKYMASSIGKKNIAAALEKEANTEGENKPDFEALSQEQPEFKRLFETTDKDSINFIVWANGYSKGCEKIWKDYVEPLQQENKTLRQQLKELKTVLGEARGYVKKYNPTSKVDGHVTDIFLSVIDEQLEQNKSEQKQDS